MGKGRFVKCWQETKRPAASTARLWRRGREKLCVEASTHTHTKSLTLLYFFFFLLYLLLFCFFPWWNEGMINKWVWIYGQAWWIILGLSLSFSFLVFLFVHSPWFLCFLCLFCFVHLRSCWTCTWISPSLWLAGNLPLFDYYTHDLLYYIPRATTTTTYFVCHLEEIEQPRPLIPKQIILSYELNYLNLT